MVPDRYNKENVRTALREPELIKKEIKNIVGLLFQSIATWYFGLKHDEEAVDVMERDWDNLIILDACRYDFFVDQNDLEGDLKKLMSGGSESWEFMQHNFVGREFHDTVYVTANPHAERLSDEVFFTVKNLLKEWDEELRTVHPDDVAEAAIEAHEKYPNKRLLVHFMQPHTPWLGETAEKLRENVDFRGINVYHGINKRQEQNKDPRSGVSGFAAVRQGKISEEAMKKCYSETLDIVLDTTERLLSELDGKSVVTSDHGEMLGEQILPLTPRFYGHYQSCSTSELRFVPWLEIDSCNRRDIETEEPIGFERLEEGILNDRLRALGYMPE